MAKGVSVKNHEQYALWAQLYPKSAWLSKNVYFHDFQDTNIKFYNFQDAQLN